ncbi:glycosyltransferase family 2 protein [Parapedobacter sp. 10938]|uniref:glycosyltransferase family 2 protein n=1 Tax=Parapedobacter flavus TaxID=3110225 RepID=UPI002DBA5A90|nr:glycosyltransferase family 2 protein [Parapedobacter sp. 10938]MEC3879886.1 glycosyltransferase family 2 protein [Parapedobacter sp. 10938]
MNESSVTVIQMMFKIPDWVKKYHNSFRVFTDIPPRMFDEVNERLKKNTTDYPVVSIVIPTWNEEANIFNCVSSLSATESSIPFEIIVVNNNSTDNTQQTLDKLNIITLFQPTQGCGPTRQLGQEHARGKYILLADADVIYPPHWLDEMVSVLQQEETVCVYGRYSFIPVDGYPRWKLAIHETLKDIIAEFRHIKRPYLNAYGMSMGYIRELGMKVGFVDHNIRGEDGRLCFDLMPFGKIRQVKASAARVWTTPRTLQNEGGLSRVLLNRLKKEGKRFSSLFSPLAPHDTKTSKN